MTSEINGVHPIRMGYVNAYLVDGDQGLTLIDTGLPKKDGVIRAKVESLGRTVDDITAILLTHSHTDHAGSAAVIKAASGANLYVSPQAAPAVRGEVKPPVPAMLRGPLKLLGNLLPGPPRSTPDYLVSEGDSSHLADDFTVLDTPGHTPGHICFLLDRGPGVLFAGDAAVAKEGELVKGFMNRRSYDYDNSIRHIAQQQFGEAHFGHSGPLMTDAGSAFQRFAATLT